MEVRLQGRLIIENLRHYPDETVENLRRLLAAGAPAVPDPQRKGFYDVHNGSRVFYIHVCPTGKVLLLATWHKPGAEILAAQKTQFAEHCACGA